MLKLKGTFIFALIYGLLGVLALAVLPLLSWHFFFKKNEGSGVWFNWLLFLWITRDTIIGALCGLILGFIKTKKSGLRWSIFVIFVFNFLFGLYFLFYWQSLEFTLTRFFSCIILILTFYLLTQGNTHHRMECIIWVLLPYFLNGFFIPIFGPDFSRIDASLTAIILRTISLIPAIIQEFLNNQDRSKFTWGLALLGQFLVVTLNFCCFSYIRNWLPDITNFFFILFCGFRLFSKNFIN